jgi:hypothetical protein
VFVIDHEAANCSVVIDDAGEDAMIKAPLMPMRWWTRLSTVKVGFL